jgi:hypothetical protein
MSILSARAVGVFAAVLFVSTQLLTGCGSSDNSDAGSKKAGDVGASDGGRDCSNVTTAGWDLFVDPRLSVQPSQEVYSLEAGDSISFKDTPPNPDDHTTYAYQVGIITDSRAVSPNRSGGFFDVTDEGTWTLKGPFAAHSVSGGPYMGILQIDATDSSGVKPIARLCVSLAKSE